MKVVAFSGGVGGAKLARGLSSVLSPDDLTIVVNTGDDFEHLGLSISPDIDSVLYAISNQNDREKGWGLQGDSSHCMHALREWGGDTWFHIGDRDLACHLIRTGALKRGHSLSEITRFMCKKMAISHTVLPMSDQKVYTRFHTDQGEMSFQDYFVKSACVPKVHTIEYLGIEQAVPSFDLSETDLLIICPSNPFLSIEPILCLAGIKEKLRHRKFLSLAVSPLIQGKAIKGPLCKLLTDFNYPCNHQTIANHYTGLIDALIIDQRDIHEKLSIPTWSTDTWMKNDLVQKQLAEEILNYARHFFEKSL